MERIFTKTLYLECNMGASGDMILSALLELFEEPERQIEVLNNIGLDGVRFKMRKDVKCGIVGTHVDVDVKGETETAGDEPYNVNEHTHNWEGHLHSHDCNHGGEGHVHSHNHDNSVKNHSHKNLNDITEIINTLNIPQCVCDDAKKIYKLVAEAESLAHGKTVEQIHFHELGNLDAIADIVGVCILINSLSPETIIVSPVNTGKGQVRTEHGILPVPAPATAHILKGVPIYAGQIKGELCTPTGAALIKYFAHRFGEMPLMEVEKIGYGMGSKDFEAENCVRIFYGEADVNLGSVNDEIAELVCNLDDMTGEALGFATSILLENGALDVFTTAAQMKKNRPGFILTCLCRPNDADHFAKLMLKHTTTFGVRKNILKRYTMNREIINCDTEYGQIRVKTGTGYGIKKSKPEYDDVEKAAKNHGKDILTVYKKL